MNAAGTAVLVVLTFFLHAAFSLPRMLCIMTLMHALWNPSHSPAPLNEILFEVFDFLFAMLAGVLAMAATRQFVPRAQRPMIILVAVPIILVYGLVTILLQGRLPAFFFPIYLDLSAAIPGWLIGFYLAGGREARESFGVSRIAAVAGPAAVVVGALVMAPSFMPFYVAVQRPTVDATFHPVLPPPSPGASFTPPPPPPQFDQSDQVFKFNSNPPNNQ
jgi:hypothetical protein